MLSRASWGIVKRNICQRNYSSEHPNPLSSQPVAEVFSSPSKPRQYYARPAQRKELPPIPRRWPGIVAFGLAGLAYGAVFLTYTTNQERLTSSATQHVLRELREARRVQKFLGDVIRPEPIWYLNGDPWIDGVVNNLQGHVDLKFRIKGHKGSGTVYFTSIRRAKGEQFTRLRFKVITDDGVTIDLLTPEDNEDDP